MNAQEFEEEVRELRVRQKLYYRIAKGSPDKEKFKEMMKAQEKHIIPYIEAVMAMRPAGKKPESEREAFFLTVYEMIERQRDGRSMSGGNWAAIYAAKDLEKEVDEQLARWEEKRAAERRREEEAAMAMQQKLF